MSYQLAFNKQELRKVIKEYPGKEVKKGLENLYRKVDKHLCEEESLLQVKEEDKIHLILSSRVSRLSSRSLTTRTVTFAPPGGVALYARRVHPSVQAL